MSKRVLFLVGPTGSGKSEAAILIAKKLGGEIISCDSMLVYRGMNIGTAKPTKSEKQGIRHHLIDLVTPRQRFSASRYRDLALQAIREIHTRNHLPIVVGGSGLYVRVLTHGLAPQDKKIGRLRAQLEREAEHIGTGRMYARLKKIDPARAAKILPNDRRRILRALEIYETLHIKPSVWLKSSTSLDALGYQWKMFGIRRERSRLYERINRRVDRMMKIGFLREVKRLMKKGLSKTAKQAIGYAELIDYVKGRTSFDEAVLKIKQRSRHLAKKQLIWFRRDPGIQWIDVGGITAGKNIADHVIGAWSSGNG